MKNLTRAVVGVAIGFSIALTTGLASNSAQAVEAENCKTVTQNMIRPDSAAIGGHNWATDTFVRTVKVCVVPSKVSVLTTTPVETATFKVVGKDVGTFKTMGVKSPKNNPMLPNVNGSIVGEFVGEYVAPFDEKNPTNWPFWNPTGSNADSTSPWVSKLWSQGHKGEIKTWGWAYTTCNEKWLNSHTDNPGDITGMSVQHFDRCLSATVKVLCDGKADVTVFNNLLVSVKITINGKEYNVASGQHVIRTVLADNENEIKVKYGRHYLAKVKCIKPTTCPTATATATPTATPTTSVTPGGTPTPTATTTTPVPVVTTTDGTGRLALTGSGGGNPIPRIMFVGMSLIVIGGGLIAFLAYRNKREQYTAE